MVAVPAVRPVTTPVVEPTGATAVVLVVHVPPAGVQDRADVEPAQRLSEPLIAPATGAVVTIMPYLAVKVPQEPLTV